MPHPIAILRAQMPTGTNSVLDRRTLERDNKNLVDLLKPGMTVLDVGCGSGAITKGIAERVGANGKVIGLDTSAELINQAIANHVGIFNLSFQEGDILNFETEQRFDLISSARTLQWMSEPEQALAKMKSLLKSKGCLSVLDYNHEKIEWQPAPPASVLRFYNSFLSWRRDAGMNNQIANHLEFMYTEAGLGKIQVSNESEVSRRADDDFNQTAGIWKKVAETRGMQLVRDGYLKEDERLAAIEDYSHWLKHDGVSMKMYLLATTGYNS